jgi:hypothetical protein
MRARALSDTGTAEPGQQAGGAPQGVEPLPPPPLVLNESDS